jgi:hypothetical protein
VGGRGVSFSRTIAPARQPHREPGAALRVTSRRTTRPTTISSTSTSHRTLPRPCLSRRAARASSPGRAQQPRRTGSQQPCTRVGLAWRVGPRTTFNTGYGINYNLGAYDRSRSAGRSAALRGDGHEPRHRHDSTLVVDPSRTSTARRRRIPMRSTASIRWASRRSGTRTCNKSCPAT